MQAILVDISGPEPASAYVTTLLAGVLSLVGILIAMFALDLWLALASLLVVPIMFWFTQFVAKYTRRGFRDLQKSLGELNAVMEEAISGQKVVKAFRRNDSVIARLDLSAMPDIVKVLSGRKDTIETCAALRASLGEDPGAWLFEFCGWGRAA